MKTMRSLFSIIALAYFSVTSAADSDVIEKLEREENTWHRYFVFTTAISTVVPQDQQAVMAWLRERVTSGTASDSRYALTYSHMLWRTRDPKLLDDATTYAVAGYLALQIESAHCETRREAMQVARQWYDPVRPQMQYYISLPRERKDTIFSVALDIGKRLSSVPPSDSKPGSDWMCYLLPSYVSKIVNLQDVVLDSRNQGSVSLNFLSHPTVKPPVASEQQLAKQTTSIIDDMKGF